MKLRISLLLFGVILLGLLGTVRLIDPPPVVAVREAYFDTLQRTRPRPPPDLPIRIVDIDDTSLSMLGQWPWPRDVMAEMVYQLRAAGVAVIAFDILFAEPDRLSPATIFAEGGVGDFPELDDALRDALRSDEFALLDNDVAFAEALGTSRIVLGTARTGVPNEIQPTPKADIIPFGERQIELLPEIDGLTPIVPVLEQAATGIASISVAPTGDTTVVRSAPLIWNTNQGVMPGLALEALRVAFGEDSLILFQGEGAGEGISAIGLGQMDIPTQTDGSFILHYRNETRESYVPAHVVLSGDAPADLSGSIVFVGSSAAGLLDLRTTALGQTVPGVSIHAQIAEQILEGRFLSRTDFVQGLEYLMFIYSGLVVAAVMSISGPGLSVIAGTVAGMVTVWASWTAFTDRGLLIDVTFPLAGGFIAFSLLALFRLFVTDRDARLTRRSFSRFVAPDVLREIEKGGHKLDLGGRDQTVTVMFSDIRQFTPLSASLSAQNLVALLNRLFTALSDAIMTERGTIDKFMGDAIMAFWNAPVQTEDHVRSACLAALRMRDALDTFNAEGEEDDIAMGIGVAVGPACVGNIGSSQQFNYTAVGETVNVAARVEAACRHLQCDIAATDLVRDETPEFAWLYAGNVDLKGVSDRQRLYVLAGGEAMRALGDFRAVEKSLQDLIDAVLTGGAHGYALTECLDFAREHAPYLEEFFHRLPARRDDFTDQEVDLPAEDPAKEVTESEPVPPQAAFP